MKTLNIAGYSQKEETLNTYTHALGILLSIVGLCYLLFIAAQAEDLGLAISYSIYGASLLSLYSASTLYHYTTDLDKKKLYKKLDHICIYYLIAGNYTPLMANHVGGREGLVVTSIVWSIAIFGTYYKLFTKSQNKYISTLTYLLMGWIVVFIWPTVSKSISPLSMKLLIYGGLAYTGGALFYLLKKVPYTHAIWHLFVLAGSILHFFAVLYA